MQTRAVVRVLGSRGTHAEPALGRGLDPGAAGWRNAGRRPGIRRSVSINTEGDRQEQPRNDRPALYTRRDETDPCRLASAHRWWVGSRRSASRSCRRPAGAGPDGVGGQGRARHGLSARRRKPVVVRPAGRAGAVAGGLDRSHLKCAPTATEPTHLERSFVRPLPASPATARARMATRRRTQESLVARETRGYPRIQGITRWMLPRNLARARKHGAHALSGHPTGFRPWMTRTTITTSAMTRRM